MKILITGITGQDGAYLAYHLNSLGFDVHGLVRRSSSDSLMRLREIFDVTNDYDLKKFVTLHPGDMGDDLSIINTISMVRPERLYNLAAQSNVSGSFDNPLYTADITAIGALRIHEAVRILGLRDHTRIYQAGTSELYGEVLEIPQSESTPFNPVSPYAVAKQYAFWISKAYRNAYNFFSSNGILFNHESPFRGSDFVTKKICRDLVLICKGLSNKLELGNLHAKRDWGHAAEYVQMQRLIIEYEKPDDFVIATGRSATVAEFLKMAAARLELSIDLDSIDNNQRCDIVKNGKVLGSLELKGSLHRPAEVHTLLGNIAKARKILGWEPKISLDQLVDEMIGYELGHGIKRR